MTQGSWHAGALEGRPLPEIRWVLANDTRRGRDLSQNSPFAGMLIEPERRRLLEEIRRPSSAIVSARFSDCSAPADASLN